MVFMRVAVLELNENDLLKRVAAGVREGVSAAGERVEPSGDFALAELIFAGFNVKEGFLKAEVPQVAKQFFENRTALEGKKIALFYVFSSSAGKHAAADFCGSVSAKWGLNVINILGIEARKSFLSPPSLTEENLWRAQGFGERTTNNAKNARVGRESDKTRIRRYLK